MPDVDAETLSDLRLLISDTGDDEVYDDAELGRFLALSRGVKRAAALALTTIAANEALLLKHITTRGLTLDGARVARELRELATALRAEADADDLDDDADGDFLIVRRDRRWPELAERPRW